MRLACPLTHTLSPQSCWGLGDQLTSILVFVCRRSCRPVGLCGVCPSKLLLSQQHLDVFAELYRTECLGEHVARNVIGRQVLYFAYPLLLQVIDIHVAHCNVCLSWGGAFCDFGAIPSARKNQAHRLARVLGLRWKCLCFTPSPAPSSQKRPPELAFLFSYSLLCDWANFVCESSGSNLRSAVHMSVVVIPLLVPHVVQPFLSQQATVAGPRGNLYQVRSSPGSECGAQTEILIHAACRGPC
jgi:hypothetical protein